MCQLLTKEPFANYHFETLERWKDHLLFSMFDTFLESTAITYRIGVRLNMLNILGLRCVALTN